METIEIFWEIFRWVGARDTCVSKKQHLFDGNSKFFHPGLQASRPVETAGDDLLSLKSEVSTIKEELESQKKEIKNISQELS